MTVLIRAHNISHQFNDKPVLHDISLAVHSGEIVTLIGPNGAGKSTLLKILLKLQTPNSGYIEHQPGLRIGYMPQKIHIDATLPLTVKHFLTLGSPAKTNSWRDRLSIGRHDTTALQRYSEELNLTHLLNSAVQSVSGGEMQRILLARALMRKPQLLVLDEPVQGVDLQGQNELYHYIDELRHSEQLGVLMVSHDLHIVMKRTDQVLCLNQHLCCSGTPQAVAQDPAYQSLFGELSEELAVYEHHHDSQHCAQEHGLHHHLHSPSATHSHKGPSK